MSKSKRRRRGIHIGFFSGLACVLALVTVLAYARLPKRSVGLEKQEEQLKLAAQAYYEAQSRNNQLKRELLEINQADFIERTARRDYGYCWYGEIIYDVDNIEDIASAMDE